MADADPEMEKIRVDAELRKLEIAAGVRKVIYGTLVVGVAAAAFPFMEKFAESFFSERIEQIQRESKIELLQEENRLAEQLAEREHQLIAQRQTSELAQRRTEYLETLADEARSDRLATRIVLAEFFAFLAVDPDERARWDAFRAYLYDLQDRLNRGREAAIAVLNDDKSTPAQIEGAIAQLRQIDRQENPSGQPDTPAPGDPVSFDALGIDPRTVNGPLRPASYDKMIELLGRPRDTVDNTCRFPTAEPLASLVQTGDAGPFRVTLIAPALESLRRVMERIEAEAPDLLPLLGSAGGLCVRTIRGSTNRFSNHSWGHAVDLKIGAALDRVGDGRVPAGLARIAPIFIDEGWVWGAGFAAEDSMHFEVSEQTLEAWRDAGRLTK